MRFRILAIGLLSGGCLAFTAMDSIADLPIHEKESVGHDSFDSDSVDAGHSLHGEAFNEGPRQAGRLIPGISKVEFPTSTESASAQKFFEQGVGQLHGFWYLEAERSFRQAAGDDPTMAIAHWGLAMANINNPKRARGLIDEAMKLRQEHANDRERRYIEALDRFIEKDSSENELPTNDEKKIAKRKRIEQYISDLENILHEYPDDIEAKAFLALAIWSGDGDGVKLTSRYAVEALLDQIFAVNPMHPAHHYRIHLWDSERPQNALQSAALCGPSSPGIAHMWHMPGHIYSKLKRYNDAAWQQEASARVDHSHMIRFHLMPDQIHNFAHNNEWLVRNLLFVGRVNDALEVSRNLISLPRHPKYNTLEKGGSFKFGRERLMQTLTQYALWDELLGEAGGDSLTPTDEAIEQEQWLGWLAVAQFKAKLGKPVEGARTMRALQRRRLMLQLELLDLAESRSETLSPDTDKPETDDVNAMNDAPAPRSRKEIQKHIDELRPIIARVAAAAASRHKDVEAFKKQAKVAKLDRIIEAQWLAQAGDVKGAIEIIEAEARERADEVRPLAVLADLLWLDGNVDRAKEEFEKLRVVASVADIDTPMLARLEPIAVELMIGGDWRITPEAASDLGERPPLDELGPMRWSPRPSESWGAKTSDGNLVASDEYEGHPRIMIFYLGFGCLHCIEQLHAFEPKLDEFKSRGIDLVAISTESVDELKTGLENFEKKMPIPLLSDAEHHVFKSFDCWDDFENQPLHGTFLIDAKGHVRWQDIGHEPFTDVEFLLKESVRLLKLP